MTGFYGQHGLIWAAIEESIANYLGVHVEECLPAEVFGQEAPACIGDFTCGLCGRRFSDVEDPAHRRFYFAGVWIGHCCFKRVERELIDYMPELLTWYQAVLAELVRFSGEMVLAIRGPVTMVPRRPEFEHLFVVLGRTAPDYIQCELCGQEWEGMDDSESNTGGHFWWTVADCCFDRVQMAVMSWMPSWLSWYTPKLERQVQRLARQQEAATKAQALLNVVLGNTSGR